MTTIAGPWWTVRETSPDGDIYYLDTLYCRTPEEAEVERQRIQAARPDAPLTVVGPIPELRRARCACGEHADDESIAYEHWQFVVDVARDAGWTVNDDARTVRCAECSEVSL